MSVQVALIYHTEEHTLKLKRVLLNDAPYLKGLSNIKWGAWTRPLDLELGEIFSVKVIKASTRDMKHAYDGRPHQSRLKDIVGH